MILALSLWEGKTVANEPRIYAAGANRVRQRISQDKPSMSALDSTHAARETFDPAAPTTKSQHASHTWQKVKSADCGEAWVGALGGGYENRKRIASNNGRGA